MNKNNFSPLGNIQLGLELVFAVLTGFAAGYWLDKKLSSSPWFLFTGSAFGVATAIYLMFKASARK